MTKIISIYNKQFITFFLLVAAAINLFAQDKIADFYRDPGINPNRNYINQSANEHIDPFTGSLQRHYVDLHLPGNGGFDLKVVRSYNSSNVDFANPGSNDALSGISGLGWTIHFGRVLGSPTSPAPNGQTVSSCAQPQKDNEGGLLSTPSDLTFELPDGSKQLVKWNANNSTGSPVVRISTQRWYVICDSTVQESTLSVFSPNGMRYSMKPMYRKDSFGGVAFLGWYTTSIFDRNNNYAFINYSSTSQLPEITNITTRDGRNVTFDYFDQGTERRRVKSISSAGQTYQYDYNPALGINNKYYLISVTRPDGNQWRYAYNDSPGLGYNGAYLLKGLVNPQGGNTNYSYGRLITELGRWEEDNTGKTVVTQKLTSDGGTWTFIYPTRQINQYDTTIVIGPSGTTTYQHIGPNFVQSGDLWSIGLLVSKTIGGTQSESYVWNKSQFQLSTLRVRKGTGLYAKDDDAFYAPTLTQKVITRDGAAYITNYSNYDNYGNIGTITETGIYGETRTTTVSYKINSFKRITNQIENEISTSGTVLRSFDSNVNLASISKDGVTTSYSYDNQGNIATTTFPNGYTHNYWNHFRGIAQNEKQPSETYIYRSVSDAGNVTTEINGEGYATSYWYDGLNRIFEIAYPAGNRTYISYTANSKTAQRGALRETTNYDGFGRVTDITLGGISRIFSTDALGRKTFESNPNSSFGTSYSYDILDRVKSIVNPDNTTQTISYGAGVKAVTNEREYITSYAYRAYGNPDQQHLVAIVAPVVESNVTILRNSKDLVTGISQGGLARGYGYNENGYLTVVTNPETGATVYGRDAAGNMTSKTVGASGTTNYSYDDQNRLVSVVYPNATPTVTNTYNKTNRLLTSNSSVANRAYSYDGNGNLSSETLTTDSRNFIIGYSYNGNDQLSAIAYPNYLVTGSVITYSPDVLGRPTQVSGYISGVTYWSSGQIKQINYTNGTVTNYNQNARMWPSSFNTQLSGVNINNSNYTYDGTGNLTFISDSVDGSYDRILGYDGINRLITSNGSWGTGSIGYSGTGNIIRQAFGNSNLSYAYDGNNRLNSVSGYKSANYSYDNYGNIVADGNNTYVYDNASNLRCINCTNPTASTSYLYDGANQRVSTTKIDLKAYDLVNTQGNLLLTDTLKSGSIGDITEFFYLGGKRIAQKQTPYFIGITQPLRIYTIKSLTSEFSPAGLNQNVILVATLESGNPGGTVTFYDGNRVLGTAPVIDGKATLSVAFSAIGDVTITATYSGSRFQNPLSITLPIVSTPQPTPVYRFRNSANGAYLLTSSTTERDTVLKLSSWSLEGAAFKAHTSNLVPGLSPVYRFRSDAGGYFYTISQSEKDAVVAGIPSYHYEGIAWYAKSAPAGNALPLYRFYNNNNGTHFFTASQAEKDYVITNIPSWTYEGISQYVWAAGTAVSN